MSNKMFGMRGHDIGDTFEEMLKNATLHGISKLQFAMAKTVSEYDFNEIGYNADVSREIKAKLEEKGLSVSVMGCYINPVERDEAALERNLTLFENFIRYAKDFNAGVIGTETGHYIDLETTHSEENYQYFIKNLRRLVAVAEENGVTIGIEPVWAFTVYSPEVMARVLDDINSPNLAVIFDLSNITTTVEDCKNQRAVMDKAFDLLGDKIRVIHLKDFKFEGGKKAFAPAATGDYDVKYLFSKLASLKNKPDIILDETPLAEYEASVKNLAGIAE